MKLYPHQQEDVAWVRERAEAGIRSHLLAHEMGVGKSVSACAIAAERGARSVLIVAPAAVRRAWVDVVTAWLPVHSVAAITKGARKSDSLPEKWRQEVLRTADVLVVSPELLDDIPARAWDVIVYDECHQVVSPRAKTFQRVRDLRTAHPGAHFLFLSGTPVSNNPHMVWTLFDLMFPGKFGKRQANGDPPHRWKQKFCNETASEYAASGFSYSGLRPEMAPVLAALVSKDSRRVLRVDLGNLLPPLDTRILQIDLDDKRADIAHILGKLDILSEESAHVAVFTWHRDRALEIYEAVRALPRYRDVTVLRLDGEVAPEARVAALANLRESPRGLLVATIDSMSTGIDLTFVQQYLLAEAVSDVNAVMQLTGRFDRLSRLGQPAAVGHFMFREGRDDDARRRLVTRLESQLALYRQAEATKGFAEILKSSRTPDDLFRRLQNLATNFTGVNAEDLNDGDDVDQDWSI